MTADLRREEIARIEKFLRGQVLMLQDLVNDHMAGKETDGRWRGLAEGVLVRSREPTPPPHTRLILASEDLLDQWGTRTERGERITVEWGDEKPEGWYEPIFTVHTDDVQDTATARIAALEGALLGLMDAATNYINADEPRDYAAIAFVKARHNARAVLSGETRTDGETE